MLVFQRSSLMTTNTPEVHNSVEFTHQTYVYYLPAHCTYCPSNQGEAAGSIEETLGNNEGVHRIIPSIRWNIDHFFSANFALNKEGCIFGKLSLKALRESRIIDTLAENSRTELPILLVSSLRALEALVSLLPFPESSYNTS